MLEKLIRDKNSAKVIEHFILHEKWEQNQKDLCEFLKISPVTMRKILENLLDLEIIKISRKIAKSKLYILNDDSDLVNPLRLLVRKLGYRFAEETANKEMSIITEKNGNVDIIHFD
jgi:hypothetical protein